MTWGTSPYVLLRGTRACLVRIRPTVNENFQAGFNPLRERLRDPLLTAQTALWGLIVLGILFRLRQYLFDRSLWLDESFLALNIIRRSPVELLGPLDYGQGAPIGFLWLQKLAVHSLGSGEMVLRLVPFLAGIGSILLFTVVARRFLSPGAVLIAVGLFSICNPLISYSSQAKQYSSDVAIVLVLYLMASSLLDAKLEIIRLILVSAAGAVAVWLSHPAAFVLAGLGLSSLWISARKNDWLAMLKISIVITIWSCSFLVCYLVSLSDLSHSQTMLDYWKGAFAPFPLSSLESATWYVKSFFGIFAYPVGLTFTGIAAVAAMLGGMQIFWKNQGRFFLLILPTAITLLASGLHLYPFQGRLLLFIVPSAILLIAAGLASIPRETAGTIPLLRSLLIGFLFFHPLAHVSREFLQPRGAEELRSVIEYVEKHRSEGDILYSYYASAPSLEYYSLRGLIKPIHTVVGVYSRQNWKPYREDLDKLRGAKRVWILFSHVWSDAGGNEEKLFLDYLDSMGKRLDSSLVTGASAYLYDLSPE